MADVTFISSSIVRPQIINQEGREKIHLTPFDLNLLYVDYTQRGLLFPKPDPETHFISRLRTSLSSALDIYFPFAGRLNKVENHEDETVSFYINCDGSGAKFIHAVSDSVSVSDLLRPDGSVPDFFRIFYPMNGVKSIDGLSEPLLALQVTEMRDGVFIGFGYNHMVADGASIWNFFRTWSKICSNGQRENLQPLALKGWFVDGMDFPIHIPVSDTETSPPSRELSPTFKERVFHFTKRNISDLKAKVNGEIGLRDHKVSSLQAVSAHMWRSIIRHSGLNQEEKTRCFVAVDLRQRLNPRLDKECFGHVIYNSVVTTTTVGELHDQGLGWAFLQINNMLRSLTNEDYRIYAENWVRNMKIQKSGLGSKMTRDSVIVSSSPRFEVYDNDFGWGKPIAVRAGPSNSISGKLVFFRGIEEGCIDVHAFLLPDVLVKLLADVEFLEKCG
ncbi:Transferase [Arabidopsis suecica]|uniref:Transferase n=1 Tax=Arabidopsis suecica TaxID=45249 RepID=A0A8T2FHA2_ARASU|nr:Transferase [Arabidopsis suecica]